MFLMEAGLGKEGCERVIDGLRFLADEFEKGMTEKNNKESKKHLKQLNKTIQKMEKGKDLKKEDYLFIIYNLEILSEWFRVNAPRIDDDELTELFLTKAKAFRWLHDAVEELCKRYR